MAPEQIQGHPRKASDQYALATVVYEWLTGSPPFIGSFTQVAGEHIYAAVPSLRDKAPTVSSEVEQVVLTALAKDPKQRFESVRAFATALEQASKGRQSETPASNRSFPSSTSPTLPATPLASLDPVQELDEQDIALSTGIQRDFLGARLQPRDGGGRLHSACPPAAIAGTGVT
jgi:serine/threonine protein kinase